MVQTHSILLIEDDDDDAMIVEQSILRDRLSMPGCRFELTHARRLQAGLDLLQHRQFDAVVLDRSLPDATELEGLNAILNLRPSQPIMVMTGLSTPEVAVAAINAGADDFLSKSDEVSMLPERLRIMIARTARSRTNAATPDTLHSGTVQPNDSSLPLDPEKLASTISHDVRAPLRHARNIVQWISRGIEKGDWDDVRNNVSKFENRVNHADEMLKALTTFLRIGVRNSPTASVNVDTLIQEVLSAINYPPEMQISVDAAGLSEKVTATAVDDLRLLLELIISNAVKHHDQQDGAINIEVSDSADGLAISISDNGPGIDDNLRPHVFDLFSRGADRKSGTGAGLAIAQRLVLQNDGSIAIVRNEPRGTKVLVDWPVRKDVHHT